MLHKRVYISASTMLRWAFLDCEDAEKWKGHEQASASIFKLEGTWIAFDMHITPVADMHRVSRRSSSTCSHAWMSNGTCSRCRCCLLLVMLRAH